VPKSVAPHRPAARINYEACPLCNSPDISSYKEADCTRHPRFDATLPSVMIWCRCGSCDHVFTKGYFAPEAVNAAFARTTPDSRVGHDAETGRVISARIVGNVARHKASGDWLDVSFGDASLLFTAKEWGFRPVGLDLHPENAQALKALGYESHCASIEKLDFPGRFSVVSLSDCLERTPFPRATLDAAHRLLQPGGVLFVAVPNMATIVWRLLDTAGNNLFWGEIEHYHNFTRERLYALLQTHGFKPTTYAVSERDPSGMEVIAVKV
jgi:2-polyprenyl-3-methyl-5-hydroxy-6-metoxy-1,4-benzoquinol methylase